jgi:hypothetical protein
MIVRTFKPQFAPLVERGEKNQTVRPPPKRKQDMPQVGQVISLRTWTGRPYFSKQRILRESVITEVSKIKILSNQIQINGRFTIPTEREEFAKRDGFANEADLKAWFQEQHGLPFSGILIRWK